MFRSRLSKILASFLALISLSIGSGVYAIWQYAGEAADSVSDTFGVGLNAFIYVPEEMPDEEVSVIQRLSDILNKKYTTDVVTDSRKYLLEETIQVYWNNDLSADPFVGSMDTTYEGEINELFQDVLMDNSVSFILKNQDLNGDGYNEIAMYSTSDPLDNDSSSYKGVVCVYVTVFTPTIDDKGQVTGYTLACESLRGYCSEIYYSPQNRVPSFSTDTWLDSVGYTRNNRDVELPEADRLNFNSYNLSYRVGYRSYTTKPMGDNLSTLLADKL